MQEKVNTDEQAEQIVNQSQAILFDLEYCVLPGRQIIFDVLKSILEEQNITITRPLFTRYGLHPLPEMYMSDLLEALDGEKIEPEKFAEDVTDGLIMHLLSGQTHLRPGVHAFMKEARKRDITLAAVTALPEERAQEIMEKIKLNEFDVALFSFSYVDKVFPRADTWLKVIKKLSLASHSCITMASCMNACKSSLSAGMRCIAVPDTFTDFQDFGGASAVLSSFDEVPPGELLDSIGFVAEE